MGGRGGAPPHPPAEMVANHLGSCEQLAPTVGGAVSGSHTAAAPVLQGAPVVGASQSCNSPLCGLQGDVGGRNHPTLEVAPSMPCQWQWRSPLSASSLQ